VRLPGITQNTRSAQALWLCGHDLSSRAVRRTQNAGGMLAAAHDLGTVHVVGGQVGKRSPGRIRP
jgi:hypothetical protein